MCKTCNNKTVDMKTGLICKLTNSVPDYEGKCVDYSVNQTLKEKYDKEVEYSNCLKGRKITVALFVCVLFFDLLCKFVMFDIHNDMGKFVTQSIVSLLIHGGLFYAIFKGLKWAKSIVIFLYVIGAIIGLFLGLGLFSGLLSFAILFTYVGLNGYVVYFLVGNEHFLRFFDYQNKNR